MYVILPDETCWFLAADFDKKTWEYDALAFLETCTELNVRAALERSSSPSPRDRSSVSGREERSWNMAAFLEPFGNRLVLDVGKQEFAAFRFF